MSCLRAALAAVVVSLGLAAALPAQDTWNDERSLALVRAATARRAVQLADTGLRDYTARATGTLTFLAKLGDGLIQTPALVKSDQIVVEVYWGAPNRSKQRIVGRRDTLLLPTDINYHRDHLGVIQNNFPDIIRLGDGDEVLDVPHPLSPIGPDIYDYRISDSLAIRGSGVSIDVMMVSVRPKDPRVPAAVGAVYLDRASASVVRMTFSFTRAALRDRQLEDVSVILENGLVEGRYWLPRRQEIEIRRSASWMDFPATGIIRGRWEICCVQANLSLPPETFRGQEIVNGGTAEQLRNYPFEGAVLGQLPEEARALDAAEVRAVQEEARRLVQEAALRRARGSNLAARGISDFVRVDRVEGLALGVGVSQRLGRGVSTSAFARYGTADSRAKLRGALRWQSASGWNVALSGADDWLQLGEVPEVSGVRNSLAAQEFGSDWTNPIGVQGGSFRVERRVAGAFSWHVEALAREERALTVSAGSAFGAFEPTLPAVALTRRGVGLGLEALRLTHEGAGRLRGSVRASGAVLAPTVGASSRVGRLGGELEWQRPLGGARIHLRTVAAAVSRGANVPVQDAVFFGGPVTGPGYDFHALRGLAGISQRFEWQRRLPFVPIDLGRFGKVPATLVLAPYAHAVWIDRPLASDGGGWFPSLGVGAVGFFDLLRVDVARGLRDGRWMFSLDVSRELWPVL